MPIAIELINVVSPTLIAMFFSKGNLEDMNPREVLLSVSALLQTVDVDFVQKKMFVTIMRDGQPLSTDDVFDNAYSGNYTEMWTALYEVVRHNGFLPLLDSAPSAADLMTRMKTTLDSVRAAATGPGQSSED
jgi:hypothetical protein